MFFTAQFHQFRAFPVACLLYLTCLSFDGNAQSKNKDEVFSKLIGTWVCTDYKGRDVLRYAKRDSLEKNTRGLIFYENGKVEIYEAFGCQTPIPNYWLSSAEWRLNSRSAFTIEHASDMRPDQKYKISKLTDRKLEIEW